MSAADVSDIAPVPKGIPETIVDGIAETMEAPDEQPPPSLTLESSMDRLRDALGKRSGEGRGSSARGAKPKSAMKRPAGKAVAQKKPAQTPRKNDSQKKKKPKTSGHKKITDKSSSSSVKMTRTCVYSRAYHAAKSNLML